MSLQLDKVHEYQVVKGTLEAKLIRTHPAMQLKRGTDPALWVQGGRIYGAGGDEVAEPPEWFWEEARKATAAARAEVGLILPEERKHADRVEPARAGEATDALQAVRTAPVRRQRKTSHLPAAPKTPRRGLDTPWTCPECGEQMARRQQLGHRWKHRAPKEG